MSTAQPSQPIDPARPTRVRAIGLFQCLAGLGAQIVGTDVALTGISLDSRTIRPGDLYVALPGEWVHGAQFVAQALAGGAVAVLTDPGGAARLVGQQVPIAVVADPRTVMAFAATRIYGQPGERLLTLGVTGTNGKTTTTLLLEAALAGAGHHIGSIGTIGFRLDARPLPSARSTVTTPESPDLQALLAVLVEDGADAVAMEVSSHALALQRVAGIRFDVAGFTNLGRDHLDFHHTMGEYFAAKAKLFTPQQCRKAVLNIDDAAGRELIRRCAGANIPVLTTGFDVYADVRIAGWQPTATGSQVQLNYRGQPIEFSLDMPGEYNVRNAATAVATLALAGADVAACLPGLSQASVPGRMQLVRLPGAAPRVYVDFAHTPQAVASALSAANLLDTDGRVIAVVGAGGDRDPDKRVPMGAAAAAGADVVVVTDDNPRTEPPQPIRAAVLAGARQVGAKLAVDGGQRRAAIRLALEMASPHDCVVILGKGHEHTQQIGGQLIDFDDVEVARQLWDELQQD